MTGTNPLDYPAALYYPRRLHATSAWTAHIPFGMFIVDLLRPRLLVELGTFTGVSYCAFCQAVGELGLRTRCYAVDTWRGDGQSGFYGPEVLAELRRHHDPLYADFSTLLQCTFDAALESFEDGSIDLLHIDGFHTYEAARRDFESWLSKLSERGVVLMHDTNTRLKGYGVWLLWEELKQTYPHFEFVHEHGLGVLAVGEELPQGLRRLVEATPEEAAVLRQFFSRLGRPLRALAPC